MVALEGIVEEIIYSNESNGYVVCELQCNGSVIVAVGCMPFISVGENIKVTGKWTTHPDYGEQLKVETYERIMPRTVDAIEKYLATGVIKGLGPATAKKIVERFGESTFEVILMNPQKLSEIKGISLEKAIRFGQDFEEHKELMAIAMFLQQYGVSPSYAARIYRTYGTAAVKEIKANPYRLADEIFGIGFKTADRIAKSLGIDPLSSYRITSGIKYALYHLASNGHTYVPEEMLKEYTSKLLEVDIDSISDALVSLVIDKSVYVQRYNDVSNIYLQAFYNAELSVSQKLADLCETRFEIDTEDFEERIERFQAKEGIVLAEMQKAAVKEALSNGVLVITGGPGTGKTTIIKCIINLLSADGYRTVLAAPTGRAARRMSEATGFEAKTIHRLLEIGYMENDSEPVFTRNQANPIDADVIIIDEMSMVDILLMNHLLKAIEPGSRLVLVGDVDQLPSVGPGNVLKDIITSGTVKTVKLTEIFRQSEESMITINAHRINAGEMPHLNSKEGDFFFLHRSGNLSIVKTVIELVTKRIPEAYGYDPMRHIQVLTPTRKGAVGVGGLNAELQNALNPLSKDKNEKIFRDFVFREGDKVMQIKNNYSLEWSRPGSFEPEGMGVFNGDTGIITGIDSEYEKITVEFDDDRIVEYDFSILDELEPAFAVTIHKSQGSEFPVVILPVFPGPQVLMTRNLLYTAITRARELVILVGSAAVLKSMVDNDREGIRYSGLSWKLSRLTEYLF